MTNAIKGHKQKLIRKIETTDNKELIDEIYRLLEIDFEETVYVTNKEQKNAVNEARKQIKNNKVLLEEEANEKAEQWLKK